MENRLGKNIRKLREANGETQSELGNYLGFAKSTIVGYEDGSRSPKPEIIQKIAEHYYISVDELMNSDLNNPFSIKDKIAFDALESELFKTMPLFWSKEAVENKAFKTGYYLLKDSLRLMFAGKVLKGDIIVTVAEKFIEATEEEIPEAVADLAWTILFWWHQLHDTDHLLKMSERVKIFGEIKLEDTLRLRKDASKETMEKREGFLNDVGVLFTECIKALKSDIDWADLGDYYLALQYTSGMVQSGLSDEMNITVGSQLMSQLIKLGNKYAISAMESTDKIIRK